MVECTGLLFLRALNITFRGSRNIKAEVEVEEVMVEVEVEVVVVVVVATHPQEVMFIAKVQGPPMAKCRSINVG